MARKIFLVLISVVALKFCSCQRRITNGKHSENGRRYMVYLLNSNYSDFQPVAWLCGGALITDQHILTSASCLTEVKYIYAIAGYKKYVSGLNIDNDSCTRRRKQKIVRKLIPKGFNKELYSPEEWIQYDIGLGVVERRYDFLDESYRWDCSYPPMKIYPNFDKLHETPGTVATVLGWGATRARNRGDEEDLNTEYLREARTVITNTSFCAHYVNDNLKPAVESSMLCAFGSGYASRSAKDPDSTDALFDSCLWRRFNLNDSENNECAEEFAEQRNRLANKLEIASRRRYDSDNDAGGICENDRGGPLVSYFGVTEAVIGIAVTSIYTSKYECEGPYLYIGIAKKGSLIKCLLAEKNETRALCNHLSNEAEKINIKWPERRIETFKPERPTIRTPPYKRVTVHFTRGPTTKRTLKRLVKYKNTHTHTYAHTLTHRQPITVYTTQKKSPIYTRKRVAPELLKQGRNNHKIWMRVPPTNFRPSLVHPRLRPMKDIDNL